MYKGSNEKGYKAYFFQQQNIYNSCSLFFVLFCNKHDF